MRTPRAAPHMTGTTRTERTVRLTRRRRSAQRIGYHTGRGAFITSAAGSPTAGRREHRELLPVPEYGERTTTP